MSEDNGDNRIIGENGVKGVLLKQFFVDGHKLAFIQLFHFAVM